MDKALIANWNAVVGDKDTVYHLGDFTLCGINAFQEYANSLRGILKIIPGSHDWRWLDKFSRDDPYNITRGGYPIEVLPPLVSLEFPELGDGKHPKAVILCHYSMRTWDRSHHNSWHLYGHSHGTLPNYGFSLDVGVDCWDYAPISLEKVTQIMRSRKPMAVSMKEDE
jgi:calcineurin-like phosphoesterase family protein